MAVQRVCDSRVPYRAASRIRIALKRVRFGKTARIGLNTLGFCKMADETADSLREMAQHRGLKLVRSRRRKPGTGDFGKFGLTDEKGKPLLGIGEYGLTASAEDIEDYLRAGAASTWQQSAKIVPNRPAPRSEPKRDELAAEEPMPRSRERRDADAAAVKRLKTPSSHLSPDPDPEPESKSAAAPVRKAASRDAAAVGTSKSSAGEKPATAEPKLVEEPALVLRPAKPADAGALAMLLGRLSGVSPSKADLTRDIAALRKAGAGVQIAELERLVGCVGWAVVPTLQRGLVGRITVLVVDEDHRRHGIGTRLLAAAEAALAKKGCALVEAMSDIEIKNAHNFFRTLKFDQTSYRFARKIAR